MQEDVERLEELIYETRLACMFCDEDGDLPDDDFGKQLGYEFRVSVNRQ